jgi:hypothetical protein
MTINVSTLSACWGNYGRYLETFLDSYSHQTFFKKMEVVLVHYEPKKYDLQLIKDFQKKYPGRLQHIIGNKVRGLYCAWNTCAKYAKGKYLAVWNIDDLRTKDSIQMQFNLIKNRNIGFVYGNYTDVTKFGEKIGNFIDYKKYKKIELTRSMILGPFYMFKKNLWNKIGFFDEQFKIAGDFDFAIRLALVSKGRMVAKNLGYYLNSQKGLSTKPNRLQNIEKDQICFRYGIFDKIEKKNLQHLLSFEVKNLLYNKKFRPINNFLKKYNQFVERRIMDREFFLNRSFCQFFSTR